MFWIIGLMFMYPPLDSLFVIAKTITVKFNIFLYVYLTDHKAVSRISIWSDFSLFFFYSLI